MLPIKLYGTNIRRLQAPIELNIKSLKAMSYNVICISEELWINMHDYEKLPFLQHMLKLKNIKGRQSEKNTKSNNHENCMI